MQQADCNRFDVERAELVEQAIEFGLRQGFDDAAAHVEPLIDFQPLVFGHQRLRDFKVQVIQVVADFTRDGQHVARALRDDQTRARALTLDQRVGDERRAVHDVIDVALTVAPCRGDLLQQVNHHGGHRFARIVRCR